MIMAAKLSQPPISAPHVAPPSKPTNITKMMVMSQRAAISANKTNNSSRFGTGFGFGTGYKPSRVADQSSSGLVGDEEEEETELPKQQDYLLTTTAGIKTHLYEALQGINRGIFGVPSAKKSEIEDLVKLLESKNPTSEPTLFLDKVGGCWKLVYSTITILGSKRTKLGLRDFISLGNFFQTIDVVEGKAVNVIMFNVRGLNLFNGQLKIEASFKVASKSRVDIKYEQSTITPEQLMNVFRKNYELLLGIFNPDGWLEITYVDDTLRIGRDDKGNIFILERDHETKT